MTSRTVIIPLLVCLASELPLWAQNTDPLPTDSMTYIVRESRIDGLVRAHVKQNHKSPGIEGYRVQVFSGSGNEARQQANDIRRQLISSNPEMPTHLVYQPPNFKVRVGDCRTEFGAIRLKRELTFYYPQGFVVRDIIKLPQLSIEGDEHAPHAEVIDGVEVPIDTGSGLD
ncbi:MAG: hypothetical protein K9J06_00945 [Flavobacteriales bacterium]|nr:hypothetical protein [Flavobacteriales bacterium]